ncbi:MAG: hypothetical protein ACI9FN_001051, partial [Saprospiraceae bacterium]
MKYLTIILLVFLFSTCLKANEVIDSIEKVLGSTTSMINRGILQLELVRRY